MEQMLCHLVGDYLTQSHWMAENKTKRSWPCFLHCLLYSLPFLILGSWVAALAIFGSHFVIDRWRLARVVVWAKNQMAPEIETGHHANQFAACPTGYLASVPPWLSVWLLIVADNTLHLLCNYAALRWL